MHRFLIPWILAGGIMLSSLVSLAEEPPVGWFFLYPQMGEGEDALPETAPSTLATLSGGFHRMYKEDGVCDANDLKKQLKYAEQYRLNFGIISESNPLFCTPWMMKKIAPAGQAIKDFYEYLGEAGIQGSRDAFQLAVKRGLIDTNCGKILMESIISRNKTVHTYNLETANEIFQAILNEYYQAFLSLKQALENEQQQRAL